MLTLLPIVLATGYSLTNAQQLTALETCAQQYTLPYLTETLLYQYSDTSVLKSKRGLAMVCFVTMLSVLS